jgi:cellulose synthase/poly-beta-1,6-N-acetylglucosamine synthase-like glycosyltransferase
MEASVGVMAYNEERNIGRLLKALLGQETVTLKIKEIIVISSGSTDRTEDIAKGFAKASDRIRLVTQKTRLGKASAIQEFLRRASAEIAIISSGDVVPRRDALEHLCIPFSDDKVGIVTARPVPRVGNTVMDSVVRLQWEMHHRISQHRPKFGELIAFRNIIREIPQTAVDEEQIAQLVQDKGLAGAYVEDAIVYNKGPKTLADFVKQRRRIHCGHIELKNQTSYESAALSYWAIARAGLALLPRRPFSMLAAVALEGYGRLLGRYDYTIGRKHYIWKTAETTK